MLRDSSRRVELGRSPSMLFHPTHPIHAREQGADKIAVSGPLIPLRPIISSRHPHRNCSFGISMLKPHESCSDQSTLTQGRSRISIGMLGILTSWRRSVWIVESGAGICGRATNHSCDYVLGARRGRKSSGTGNMTISLLRHTVKTSSSGITGYVLWSY